MGYGGGDKEGWGKSRILKLAKKKKSGMEKNSTDQENALHIRSLGSVLNPVCAPGYTPPKN